MARSPFERTAPAAFAFRCRLRLRRRALKAGRLCPSRAQSKPPGTGFDAVRSSTRPSVATSQLIRPPRSEPGVRRSDIPAVVSEPFTTTGCKLRDLDKTTLFGQTDRIRARIERYDVPPLTSACSTSKRDGGSLNRDQHRMCAHPCMARASIAIVLALGLEDHR